MLFQFLFGQLEPAQHSGAVHKISSSDAFKNVILANNSGLQLQHRVPDVLADHNSHAVDASG